MENILSFEIAPYLREQVVAALRRALERGVRRGLQMTLTLLIVPPSTDLHTPQRMPSRTFPQRTVPTSRHHGNLGVGTSQSVVPTPLFES